MVEPREPRRMDEPQVGHWWLQAVKHGPKVPARIFHYETTTDPDFPENDMTGTRYRFLSAEIAGDLVPLSAVWERKGDEISQAEFKYRVAEIEWAKSYAPTEAIANPRKPVDRATIPLPF